MDFNQESDFDLRVLRGQNDLWQVIAQDSPHALKSFDDPHEACAWAIALAKSKRGRVFVEEALVDCSSFVADLKLCRRRPT